MRETAHPLPKLPPRRHITLKSKVSSDGPRRPRAIGLNSTLRKRNHLRQPGPSQSHSPSTQRGKRLKRRRARQRQQNHLYRARTRRQRKRSHTLPQALTIASARFGRRLSTRVAFWKMGANVCGVCVSSLNLPKQLNFALIWMELHSMKYASLSRTCCGLSLTV